MNLDYYKNFRVIVETGSLSAAAKKLHIAQSALSSQLKSLEEKFGAELITTSRGIRQVTVTDAGKILYERSDYISKLDDIVEREIAALGSGTEGTLRISLSPSMSIPFISGLLNEFSKLYPKVHYELYEVAVAVLEDQLLNGLTEVGVASAPLAHADEFNIHCTSNLKLAAVYPLNNKWIPVMDEECMPLEALNNLPVHLSRGCFSVFKNVCTEAQVKPDIVSVNTTKLSTVTWARHGAGIAIIPVGESDFFAGYLCCKTINDARLQIEATLITPKKQNLSPVTKRFIDYCKSKQEKEGWSGL